jgi:hypothetical protein
MARPQVILPYADAACGKAFYRDRRTADWHRIALEFWNQATGHTRTDCRLTVYRCKRCGGFHISQKRVESPGNIAKSSTHSLEEKQTSLDSDFRRSGRRNGDADGRSAEVTD